MAGEHKRDKQTRKKTSELHLARSRRRAFLLGQEHNFLTIIHRCSVNVDFSERSQPLPHLRLQAGQRKHNVPSLLMPRSVGRWAQRNIWIFHSFEQKFVACALHHSHLLPAIPISTLRHDLRFIVSRIFQRNPLVSSKMINYYSSWVWGCEGRIWSCSKWTYI